jgi:hypothetical protein
MKTSDLAIGTVYLVNERKDWQTSLYGAKAYRLMALDKFSAKGAGRWNAKAKEVTIDGVTYSHFGRPWSNKSFDGEVKYLMIEVDRETHEPIGKSVDGLPFLSLIAPREIRGEWATARAEAATARQEADERRSTIRERADASLARMTKAANRFRSVLGLEADSYSSLVSNSMTRYDNAAWGQGVTLSTTAAETVLDRLAKAEARAAELEATLRDAYGHHVV